MRDSAGPGSLEVSLERQEKSLLAVPVTSKAGILGNNLLSSCLEGHKRT